MPSKSQLIRSSKEIILLLLYSKGKTNKLYEPIKGRTRLMKMIFLFKEELQKAFNKNSMIDIASLSDFSAYDFGPFSYEVLNDLDFLKTNDFISITEVNEESIPEELFEYIHWINEANLKVDIERYVPEEFSITRLGIEFVNTRLVNKLTIEQLDLLNEFKKRCTEISLRTLLKYVYINYPKMTTKSKIREEILKEYY